MLTAYERRLVLTYLSNVASRFNHRSPQAQALYPWMSEQGDLLGLAIEDNRRGDIERLDGPGHTPSIKTSQAVRAEWSDALASRGLSELGELLGLGLQDNKSDDVECPKRPEQAPSLTGWQAIRDGLSDALATVRRARPDRTAKRLRSLGREVGLSRTDIGILELVLRYHTHPQMESMVDKYLQCFRGRRGYALTLRHGGLSELLGLSRNVCFARLVANAPLVSSGLLSIDGDGDIGIMDRLKRLPYATGSGRDARRLLFDVSPPGELDWSDFEHIAEHRDHVESLIRGALQANAPGVNVLVYGPPGTGKTQFCRTLANRLGLTLYGIGEADDDGHEPTRIERLQELKLGQRLFANTPDTVLLFDEMEDLLSQHTAPIVYASRRRRGRRGSDGSKVFMHRLLETNAVPTLWTTNSASDTSPALLRRMMYAIELRQPSPRVRTRVWARQLARHGIESSDDQVRELARDYDVSPGVVAGATAAARLIEGDGLDAVRRGVQSLSKLLHGEKPPQRAPGEFDPGLIRCDIDPTDLSKRFASLGKQRVSLCLSGPPGTGKSAFVRHLAEQAGLEVVSKRASDLLSMWVGGTEARIASAFAEAREGRLFLVFDEADSLLGDRRNAHRSWEISQVNEMLTWMESHPLPFACTTNYAERLDPATLRRFNFKVVLDYLSAEQASAAFRLFFELDPPPRLSALSGLTPGDFDVVRRRAALLEQLDDADALVSMLYEECAAKPDRPTPIGFCP